MINRIALTVVFVLSFATYLAPEPTMAGRFAPLVAFFLLAITRLLSSKRAFAALGSLLSADGIVFVLFLPLLMLGSSLSSNFSESVDYWLLMSAFLVFARLYMATVPVSEVFEAFFWSGVVCVGLIVVLAFSDLAQTIRTLARFTAFSFEPNVLAFILAGYFCAMLWKVVTGPRLIKVIAGIVGSGCLVVVFFASSRGSLLGICAGVGAAIVMVIARERRRHSKELLRIGILTIVLLAVAGFALEYFGQVSAVYGFVDQVLSLSSADRGIDSGLTGRADKWKEIINDLSDGTWLFGRGLRSSDSMHQPIDNSYLVIMYELGVFPLFLLVCRFLFLFGQFARNYFRVGDRSRQYLFLACSMIIIVFLVSDFVGRFMLALANPYSLMTMLFFVIPTFQLSQPLKTAFSQ